ncbi:hypothetical protein M747DRAFT_292938 [Aspergillus niger ATCC 13496]|uniref:Secreted protein n=1 Tax=Aspergillus niger ATCC 13496 TaxID=1353008 RepID=A0A370C7J8_ASPNG|nr:hypothetical protein M747DRAFT_292938 [Aspergillus niger ATCC 13496]
MPLCLSIFLAVSFPPLSSAYQTNPMPIPSFLVIRRFPLLFWPRSRSQIGGVLAAGGSACPGLYPGHGYAR